MMIDRIGFMNPVFLNNNSGLNNQVNRLTQTDSVKLSLEALAKGDFYRACDIANAAPDVRLEMIAEIKAQINDPSFVDNEVLGATADKLMEVFRL
jgi:negative regulator of flagellin synthesis FlgM